MLLRSRLPAYDLSNPAIRIWWLYHAAEVCASSATSRCSERGYLLLDVGKVKKDAVAAAYGQMMQALPRKLGPEKLSQANITRARFPQGRAGRRGYFEGSWFEHAVAGMSREHYIAKGIAAFEEAARAGKIIAFTMGMGKAKASEMGIDGTGQGQPRSS